MRTNWISSVLCKTDGKVFGITTDNKGFIYYTLEKKLWRVHTDGTGNHSLPVFPTAKFDWKSFGVVWDENSNSLLFQDHTNVLSYDIYNGNLSKFLSLPKEEEMVCSFMAGISLDTHGCVHVSTFAGIAKNIHGALEVITGSDDSLFGPGYKDGNRKDALYDGVKGIAVSTDGVIYAADQNNHCIRKIEKGTVSSIGSPNYLAAKKNKTTRVPLSQSSFKFPFAIHWLQQDKVLVVSDSLRPMIFLDLKNQTTKCEYIPNMSKDYFCFCVNPNKEEFYFGGEKMIIKVECVWKCERYLWIGHLKEDKSYCLLAMLPKELVREISSFVQTT